MKNTPRAPVVTVTVTKEAIEQAKPRDSGHCMVADSVKAAFPDAEYVSVDLATVRFTDPRKGLRYTYLSPRSVATALVQWDAGIVPEPWKFRIRNGHVTRAGKRTASLAQQQTPKQRAARVKVGKKAAALLAKTRLRRGSSEQSVPDRVGGKTPPLMPVKGDNIAFSRRRAFGLRALEL
jgi:hypothetical protein